MASNRDVTIRIAVTEYEQARNCLRALGADGTEAASRIESGFRRTGQASGQAADQVSRSGRQINAAMANTAQQLQDVAVQFQAGTSAAVIFAQQGPEILGAWGPMGAAIGAVTAVVAVAASAMFGFGKEAEATNSILDDTIKRFDDSKDAADRYGKSLLDLTDGQRKFARAAAELELERLRGQAGDLSGEAAQTIIQPIIDKFLAVPREQRGTSYSQFREGLKAKSAEIRAAMLAGDGDRVSALFEQSDILKTEEGLELAKQAVAVADRVRILEDVASGRAETVRRLQEQQKGLATSVGGIDAAKGERFREDFEARKKAAEEAARAVEALSTRIDSAFNQSANNANEKITAVRAKLAVTLAEVEKLRGTPGFDADAGAAKAKAAADREIAGIQETAAKAAEAARKRADNEVKQTQREIAAREEKVASAQREAEQMEALAAANEKGTKAHRELEIQIKAENEARSLGTEATDAQREAVYKATVAEERARDQIKRTNEVRAEQLKQLEIMADFYERGGAQIDQALDREEAATERATERLEQQLESNVASAIERGFEDGFGSIGDLVDQFGSLLKSTVATALADSLITEGLAKSISGALGTQLGTLIPSMAGTKAGTTTVGGAAAGAAGAGLGGYAIGQQFEGNRPLGTLAGAASGAAIGFAVGGGPVGAAVGGAIGGIAGFFGSGGGGGGSQNNNYQYGFDPATGRPVSFPNTKPDSGNVQIVQGVLKEVATLREGLRGLGLDVGGGQITVQAGNKSGMTLNGQRFGGAQALNEAALRQLLEGTDGLTGTQKRVLRNTDATTAAGILSDLDLARQLDDLAKGGGALGAQLRENARQFDDLRSRAEDLKLSTKALDEAEKDGLRAIRQSAEAQLGIVGPLKASLRDLDTVFEEASANRRALGLSQKELDEAQKEGIRGIRQALEAQLGIVGPLEAQLRALDQAFEDASENRRALGLSQKELDQAQREGIRSIRQSLEAQLGIVGPLEAQLRALDAAFKEASENRRALGLSQKELDQAQKDGIKAIRQGLEAQLGIVGPLEAQLRALDAAFAEASENRRALGLSQRELDQAQKDGIKAIRQSLEAQLGIVGPLKAQLRALDAAFKEASENRRELGLSQRDLDQAQKDSIAAIRQGLEAQLGLVSPLEAQIRALDQAFEEASESNRKLGISQKELDRAQAEQREALIDAYTAQLGILTPLQQQVANINATFADARDDLKLLGLSEKELKEARADALAATRNAALAQLGFISPLTQTVNDLVTAFDEAAESAKFLNLTEKELKAQRNELIQQAKDAARDQYVSGIESAYAYVDNLRGFRDSLATGENGTDATRFAAAKAQYEQVRSGALAGDLEAIDRIQSVGQTYLTAARDFGASGAVFQNAFRDVNEVLTTLINQGQTREAALLEGVGATNRTLDSIWRDQQQQHDELLEELKAVSRALRQRAA